MHVSMQLPQGHCESVLSALAPANNAHEVDGRMRSFGELSAAKYWSDFRWESRASYCVREERPSTHKRSDVMCVIGLSKIYLALSKKDLGAPIVPVTWIWILNEICKSISTEKLLQMQHVVRRWSLGVKTIGTGAPHWTRLRSVTQLAAGTTFYMKCLISPTEHA